MTPSKVQRWLDILAVLIGNRYPVPIDRLMESVPAYRDRWVDGDETDRKSVRRMFERDKDELRRIGIPLSTRDLHGSEGYSIARRDLYLPYLALLDADGPGALAPPGAVTLTESDARIAVRALREVIRLPSFPFPAEARTALRKLTFDLDPALTDEEAGGADAVRVLDRVGGADPRDQLETLIDGLYDRRNVTFRYHSIGRNATEDRVVEPWGLLYQWGSWYLVAKDAEVGAEGADGPRLFRLDRMAEAKAARPSATRPDFEVPEAFDLGSYSNREPWELGSDEAEPVEVHVRFHPPASLLARRNDWGELVEEEPDGSSLRSFAATRIDPLIRWVLAQGGEAEVVSPPEAVERLRAMADEVLRLYETEER